MREDWKEIELGNICFTTSGGTPSRQNKSFYEGNIPWVKSGELDKGIILDSEEHITEEAIKKSSAKVFPKGTLLFALYGATIGKMATLGVEAATNQAICGIYENDILISKYLYHYLSNKKRKLIGQGIGGAQPNISQTILKKLIIPISPLPEQRAIVAKIEELFSDLDKGIDDLKKAQAQLVIFRQAVLKKAFEGELTNTQMTPRTLDSLTSIITKGASPKWQGFDYTTDSNQLLFVTSENVREGYISLEKEKYLPVGFNEVQKRSVLQKGDVLFNIVGASIGRAAIFELDKLSNINQAVALIRLDEEVLNQYVNYFLNSEGAKQEYLKKQVEVARANLSLQNVKDIEIPFCNVDEQRIVIQEIESRLSVCDTVEQSIAESLEKAKALRQSILKKAFEGTLLSAEEIAACKAAPDYEPASVLLEKIKAEKKKP